MSELKWHAWWKHNSFYLWLHFPSQSGLTMNTLFASIPKTKQHSVRRKQSVELLAMFKTIVIVSIMIIICLLSPLLSEHIFMVSRHSTCHVYWT